MPKNALAVWAAAGALTLSAVLHPTATRGQQTNRSTTTPAPRFPNTDSNLKLHPSPPQNSDTVSLSAPGGEVRAMWVVRDSMTSPQAIKNAIALARKYHFNTVFVQVRGRGDAFYDSRFEPRAEQLADQPLSFDPLAVAVEEGHKAGLQVHAWLNTFLVWHHTRRPYSAQHIVNRHPEWLVRDKHNRITWTNRADSEGAFLDPTYPEVRAYTRDVFLDVATRYNVDGIHFDYVRFPSDNYSFSDYSLARFREHMLPTLTPAQVRFIDAKRAKNRLAWYHCLPREWKVWRQQMVTETVHTVADAARRARPDLVVSAAVFPNYSVATASKGQAWRDWLRDGLLDAACPMSYNRSTKLVAAQIRDAIAGSHGKPIIAGVGAWQMSAESAIAKAIAFRDLGAAGINFFSLNGMTERGRGEHYLSKVRGALFRDPVPTPDWRKSIETARGGNKPGRG